MLKILGSKGREISDADRATVVRLYADFTDADPDYSKVLSPALPHYFTRQFQALPAWRARRQKQFISTGKLTLQVGGAYETSNGRQSCLSDTRTHQLEDVLAGVVREVEMRWMEGQQEAAEADREARDLQERWEQVRDDAERRAIEAHRAEVLAGRALAWRDWQDQQHYVEDLERHLAVMMPEERASAEAWVTWSKRLLERTDPMRADHEMPATPDLNRDFVAPHVRNWAGQFKAFRVE